jgi:uncharacterized protein (TIGR02466 family)
VVNHLFTTPILHERLEPPRTDFDELCDYLLDLRARSTGQQRSNRGGWHSDGNLFGDEHRAFPWLRELMVKHVLAYAGEGLGFTGEFHFQLTGWAVANRAGDYNVPHNHCPNLLSGAFYIRVPEGMKAGEIVFLDPRLALNANVPATLQKRGQLPPWHKTSLSHPPVIGDLLIFPSWLTHYVNAFTAPEPEAVRIVVSFNVNA